MEKAAIFMTGKAISHFRQDAAHCFCPTSRAPGWRQTFRERTSTTTTSEEKEVSFPTGPALAGGEAAVKRKIGGMVPLWPLGTLWLAYFAARAAASDDAPLKCEDLRIGQYICEDPKIDNATQEPIKCTNHTAYVACLPAPNITCKDFSGNETQFTGNEIGFYQPIECRSVNGYSYKVAVALSLFLGWLGADRFYLGYPALGLLKFCTVGFCGIGSLIDFILISMQIVGPSDGSNYIIDYYGARLTRLSITNDTYRKPQMYP